MAKSEKLAFAEKYLTREEKQSGIETYVVMKDGEILFSDPVYSICNSFIINNALQGIRPKPVYRNQK